MSIIIREVPPVAATVWLPSRDAPVIDQLLQVVAKDAGVAGNDLRVYVSDVAMGDPSRFYLSIYRGSTPLEAGGPFTYAYEAPSGPELGGQYANVVVTAQSGAAVQPARGWFDLAGGADAGPDVPTTPAWAPTIDDVGALLRARTKDVDGAELGVFDDTTRPTGSEVELLIRDGCARVAARIGWDVPDKIAELAGHLAALYAAVEVEEGYWPEQVNTDRSARNELWERFLNGLEDITAAASALGIGGLGAGQGSIFTVPAETWAWWHGWTGVPPEQIP